MLGILVDTTIIKELVKKFMPKLSVRIEEKKDYLGDFIGNNFINRGLTNLFSNGMIDKEISLIIWDYLFLEGNKVLFQSFLAIYNYLSKIILSGEASIEFYNEIINNEIKKLNKNDEDFIYNLFFKFDKALSNNNFDEYRFDLSLKVADTIEEQNIEHVKSKVKLSYDKKLYDKQLNKIKTCDKKWPYCISDTYFENVTRTVFYTVFHEVNNKYINDFFFSEKKNEENKVNKKQNYYNLRIERRPHYCNQIQNEININEEKKDIEEDKNKIHLENKIDGEKEGSSINILLNRVASQRGYMKAAKEIGEKINININSLENED